MSEAVPNYDCITCAACCRTFPVYASQADAVREPRIRTEAREVPPHLADVERAFQMHPLPFLETCCFLGGDLRCRVYPSRPDVCRRFEPGSPQCLEARERTGIT